MPHTPPRNPMATRRGLVSVKDNVHHVDFGGSEPLLTKTQLAVRLGRSRRWIELRAREGMPSQMDGNRRMFRASDVDEWLERNGRSEANG